MKIAFYTLGCKVNQYETQALEQLAVRRGHTLVPFEGEADAYVINTCTVTAGSDKKSRHVIRRARKTAPDGIIAVCGCYPQTHPEDVGRLGVDLIAGTGDRTGFVELLERTWQERQPITALDNAFHRRSFEALPAGGLEGRTRAMLKIEDGCVNFCSYCIVPYVRGRERSRDPQAVLAEVRQLVEAGYKDITLLGQNVNSYGKDLGTGMDFPTLLEQANAIEGEFLLRFMTSHPKDATERLFDVMAKCEKVAPCIHLPFQSGNTRVLQAMNRRYTREQYLDKVHALRERIPNVVLTSDVIVGFPGETTPEFEDTLSLIEEVRYDALFTFIYSPRKGTPAAEMEDPMRKEEKSANFNRLVEAQNRISLEKHQAYIGTIQHCLVDGESEDPRNNLNARTPGGRLVHLNGDVGLIGQFVDVKITDCSTWALFGELV